MRKRTLMFGVYASRCKVTFFCIAVRASRAGLQHCNLHGRRPRLLSELLFWPFTESFTEADHVLSVSLQFLSLYLALQYFTPPLTPSCLLNQTSETYEGRKKQKLLITINVSQVLLVMNFQFTIFSGQPIFCFFHPSGHFP